MAETQELLQRLQTHLQLVHDDPSTPMDQKLLDTASYIYSPELGPEASQSLILEIYQVLPSLQQDPAPLIRLLSKLLEPVPLSNVLSIVPTEELIPGLDIQAQPYNLLTLSLLEKADASSAQRLATSHPQLFVSLVQLWLATENEGVADKASKVILHLLAVDKDQSEAGGWDGSVWKRIFRDKGIYGQIYEICSLQGRDSFLLSKSRKTIAQARLLDWIPSVAQMDWETVTRSHLPDIERSFDLDPAYEGLMDFAAVHMVDFKSDVLMHRSLINFYTTFLTTIIDESDKVGLEKPGTNANSSLTLDFLTTRGLHSRTIAYYIEPDHASHDPLDATFLYGPAADYVASYVSTYPANFAQSGALQTRILQKITTATNLADLRRRKDSPAEDLHVLSSIPRAHLAALGSQSPHLTLPIELPNPDILNTLATLFHGPLKPKEITFPTPSPSNTNEEAEIQAAKSLYESYVHNRDTFWPYVLAHADTLALAAAALAATNLIKAIVTAPWDGLTAIMDDVVSKHVLVPWLVGPPKRFSNLVGGVGDAESAAYKVAVARFECLKAFCEGVRASGRAEWKAVGDVARRRLEEGVWGGTEVGGRVGTLEL